jgi:hypothetical protein
MLEGPLNPILDLANHWIGSLGYESLHLPDFGQRRIPSIGPVLDIRRASITINRGDGGILVLDGTKAQEAEEKRSRSACAAAKRLKFTDE